MCIGMCIDVCTDMCVDMWLSLGRNMPSNDDLSRVCYIVDDQCVSAVCRCIGIADSIPSACAQICHYCFHPSSTTALP